MHLLGFVGLFHIESKRGGTGCEIGSGGMLVTLSEMLVTPCGMISAGTLDFRHTFGSPLAMAGISLYKISALMGNSQEICRKHYAALIPEALV